MNDPDEVRDAFVRALMQSIDEDLENLLNDDSREPRASSSCDE